MTPGERWLAALWPSVRALLPAPPARVLEIGCGPLGGFVPMLRVDGYEATGIDPEAPEEGTGFRRIGFEDYQPARPADAIIACTSLHHVADLGCVADLIGTSEAGELAAIEAGQIRANRIQYHGTRRPARR